MVVIIGMAIPAALILTHVLFGQELEKKLPHWVAQKKARWQELRLRAVWLYVCIRYDGDIRLILRQPGMDIANIRRIFLDMTGAGDSIDQAITQMLEESGRRSRLKLDQEPEV